MLLSDFRRHLRLLGLAVVHQTGRLFFSVTRPNLS